MCVVTRHMLHIRRQAIVADEMNVDKRGAAKLIEETLESIRVSVMQLTLSDSPGRECVDNVREK